MKHAYTLPALVVAALVSGPAFGETDAVAPKVLVLPDNAAAVLPGDHEGAKHGVIVRRGSGFPEPVVAEAPAPIVVEARPVAPRVRVRKKRYGW